MSPTDKRITSAVEVTFAGKPKTTGLVKSGHLQGRTNARLRELELAKTKEALEHANRTAPPNGTQWTKATIKHGFNVDSSGTRDRAAQRGTSRPHVNALVEAANGYKKTVHVDFKARVEPKPPRERPPRGPLVPDEAGGACVKSNGPAKGPFVPDKDGKGCVKGAGPRLGPFVTDRDGGNAAKLAGRKKTGWGWVEGGDVGGRV